MPKGTLYGSYAAEDHSLSKTDFYNYARDFSDVINDFPINPDKYTRPFTVMINGKRRKIVTYQANDSGDRLRKFHRILAAVMRRHYTPSNNSYAYKHGSCVRDALLVHLESDTFLKTDIHSYFDTIDYKTLEATFVERMTRNGYRKGLWIKALQTCFYNGHLPIGFISSPMLSDLFLHDIDMKYASIKGVKYTRYADDLIVSGTGEGVAEKLAKIRVRLEKDLSFLGLELNKKKTYIRKLTFPGDAIHLLGLNMVKRAGFINDITVSDRYIREASKELCLLIAQKPYLDDAEARKRFMAVMGRIDYIKNSSDKSADKLRKMILIKSGVDTDLTYKSLEKLCVNNPKTVHDHIVTELRSAEDRIYPIHYFPSRGKVWIRFISTPIVPTADKDIYSLPAYKGLKTKVMQLCRNDLSPGGAKTTLKYLRLTINGETKYYTGELKQAEEILAFSKGMSKCPYPISLFFEYSYDLGHSYSFKEDKNHIHSSYNWLSGKVDTNYGIIVSDEENRNWEFRRESSSDSFVQYGEDLLTETNEGVFQTHSEWTGEATMNAYWPLNTEHDLDTKIRKCIDEYKELVNTQGQHTDGIRSIDSTLSLHCSGEDATKLINKIKELTSLINQTDGELKLTLWMVPEDFLVVGSEKPFDYVKVTVSEAGRTKVRACTL